MKLIQVKLFDLGHSDGFRLFGQWVFRFKLLFFLCEKFKGYVEITVLLGKPLIREPNKYIRIRKGTVDAHLMTSGAYDSTFFVILFLFL